MKKLLTFLGILGAAGGASAQPSQVSYYPVDCEHNPPTTAQAYCQEEDAAADAGWLKFKASSPAEQEAMVKNAIRLERLMKKLGATTLAGAYCDVCQADK